MSVSVSGARRRYNEKGVTLANRGPSRPELAGALAAPVAPAGYDSCGWCGRPGCESSHGFGGRDSGDDSGAYYEAGASFDSPTFYGEC